jgi:nucleoside-diphosphate-sugar epimerase
MKVLGTGAADFVGLYTANQLSERGDKVVGFDVVNDYYDPARRGWRWSAKSPCDQSNIHSRQS